MPETGKTGRRRTVLLSFLLALSLLPSAAFAGTSSFAPEIGRKPARTPVASTDLPSDPQIDGMYGFTEPWLTDLELAKFIELRDAMKDGDISYMGPSIVNPASVTAEDAAVFSLDPAEFDGERFYVFLPESASLTDGQLAALAAAFMELGISFDPDSLNDRNCCRNKSMLETRSLTAEENGRMEGILDKIRRGLLKKEDVPDDPRMKAVEKTAAESWGLSVKTFFFYPYRQMTDSELALFALVEETAWETDPDALKAAALEDAGSLVSLPENMSVYAPAVSRECLRTNGLNVYKTRGELYKYTGTFHFNGYDSFYENISCNMDVILMQESGSAPGLAAIRLGYGYYSDFTDRDYPESREAEWLASVQRWAGRVLRLPAEALKNGWTVSLTEKHYSTDMVQLQLMTEAWEIRVWLYRNSAKVSDCLIYNRKWYHEAQKGFSV